MADVTIHQCQCPPCRGGQDHPDRHWHYRINLVMSRLDEQQRRWLAALESQKVGYGGDTLLAFITGLHVDTIRRGREELDADHPDRDRQFRYIEGVIEQFRAGGLPILSVDAKKKELVGNFGNGGRAWVTADDEVNAHDFLSDALCRSVPYGLFDVLANKGHIVV